MPASAHARHSYRGRALRPPSELRAAAWPWALWPKCLRRQRLLPREGPPRESSLTRLWPLSGTGEPSRGEATPPPRRPLLSFAKSLPSSGWANPGWACVCVGGGVLSSWQLSLEEKGRMEGQPVETPPTPPCSGACPQYRLCALSLRAVASSMAAPLLLRDLPWAHARPSAPSRLLRDTGGGIFNRPSRDWAGA